MTGGPLAQKFWDSIPPEHQREIEKRAAERIAEYRSLQELQQSAGLTQSKVCEEFRCGDIR